MFFGFLSCQPSLREKCPYSSGPYFSAFGVNTERYGVSLRIKSECGKIRTRKNPNTDNFHAVRRSFFFFGGGEGGEGGGGYLEIGTPNSKKCIIYSKSFKNCCKLEMWIFEGSQNSKNYVILAKKCINSIAVARSAYSIINFKIFIISWISQLKFKITAVGYTNEREIMFLESLDYRKVTNNRTFWKSIQPFFFRKTENR